MEDVWESPFAGPPVWKRCDARPVCGITRFFSGSEQAEDLSVHARRHIAGVCDVKCGGDCRMLHSVCEVVDHVRSELLDGCGFTVLHDVVSDEIDVEALKRRYCEVGRLLGELAPQNAEGDLLRCVTDQGPSRGNRAQDRARGHRGRSRMSPHTDSADFAALFCLRPARSGGASLVCSAAALYNEILARRPDYLGPLIRGFHFDLTGKTKSELGVTEGRVPVFSVGDEQPSCVFNKDRIVLGMRKAGLPLDEVELESVEYLDALAKSEEFTLSFTLQAGDVLFLNNRRTLHARDEYVDWPEANRKRLLLRLWMNLDTPPRSAGATG
jgi:hypothetical protein